MTAVLLLEPAGPESAAIIAAAGRRGIAVHAATGPGGPPLARDVAGMLAGLAEAPLADEDQALDLLACYARAAGISGILTASEFLTPLAARLAAALSLPGNDPARIGAARDKALMAAAFGTAGTRAPATRLAASPGDVTALARDLPFPWVVKPARGAGSRGVTVAAGPQDAVTAIGAALESRLMYGAIATGPAVVQEHVDGTEYSIESVTSGGTTAHLCATAKLVTPGPHRAELGHGLPAALPERLRQEAFRQAGLAISAAGITSGPAHTELIITPAGDAIVLEVAARIAAGHIGHLIGHALGISVWDALLDTALGHTPRLAAARSGYAAVRFITAPAAGRLTAITGLPAPGPAVPAVSVRARPGDPVRPAAANADRLGHIIVTGPGEAAVTALADNLMARIRVGIDPG